MLRTTIFNPKHISITVFILLFIISMASASYLATVPTHQILSQSPKQETLGITTEPSATQQATASATPTNVKKNSNQPPVGDRSVMLGMWTEGMWEDSSLIFHAEKLQQLEGIINKKVAIAHFYTGWENLSKDSILPQLNAISLHGWTPMISINPYFTSECSANGKTIYQAIANGSCDSLLHRIGHILSEVKSPILLRFAWEMNIDSMPWSIQKIGGTPADFISAWQHFHDIVRSDGGSTVKWVFSPNTENASSIPIASLYPGDNYIDWVALDGYNWGTTQSWSSWQSFRTVFSKSYSSLRSVAPSKPVMIAEVNSTEKGGNKAEWYKDMLETQIPENFPAISAVIFYNEDRTAKESVNWLITSSPQSLSAFKEAIQSPLYRSTY